MHWWLAKTWNQLMNGGDCCACWTDCLHGDCRAHCPNFCMWLPNHQPLFAKLSWWRDVPPLLRMGRHWTRQTRIVLSHLRERPFMIARHHSRCPGPPLMSVPEPHTAREAIRPQATPQRPTILMTLVNHGRNKRFVRRIGCQR